MTVDGGAIISTGSIRSTLEDEDVEKRHSPPSNPARAGTAAVTDLARRFLRAARTPTPFSMVMPVLVSTLWLEAVFLIFEFSTSDSSTVQL